MPLTKRQQIALFCFSLVLSCLYLDWGMGWNIVSRMAMPLSLLLENNWHIDTYATFTGDKATINGHYFSDKGPLPGLLLYPFLALLHALIDLSQFAPAKQLMLANITGGIVLGALPFALSLMACYRFLYAKLPAWLVLVFFFGSFLFAFAGSAFSHVLTGYFILLSYLLLRQGKPFLTGLLIGAAFCSEYSTAIFGFFWGAYWLGQKNYRALAWLIAGALPFIIFQGWYNQQITGEFWLFAYKFQENFSMNSSYYGFRWPSLQALWHLSVSSYRGLFFYAPLLLVLLLAQGRMKWRPNWQEPRFWALAASIFYIFLFSMSKSWYGGWTFGPRYLLPAALLLFVSLGINSKLRAWHYVLAIVLGLLSLMHSVLNKITVLYPPTDVFFPARDIMLPALLEGRLNQMNLFSAAGLNPAVGAAMLSAGIVALIFWAWYQEKLINQKKQALT